MSSLYKIWKYFVLTSSGTTFGTCCVVFTISHRYKFSSTIRCSFILSFTVVSNATCVSSRVSQTAYNLSCIQLRLLHYILVDFTLGTVCNLFTFQLKNHSCLDLRACEMYGTFVQCSEDVTSLHAYVGNYPAV